MNLILHCTVFSLFCFYCFLLETDAGTHGNLLTPAESTETKIPADIMNEFYTGIDTQEDKYVEAIEKVKARKPHRKKAPNRIKLNTENELTVSRRNLHKPHKKSEKISKSTLDMGDFAKFSRKRNTNNVTKSHKKRNLRKSNKRRTYKRITPNFGENSPVDIIIHIKMREPKQGSSEDE